MIDTSSIIYIQKTGFLPLLTRTIALSTIPEVLVEVGTDLPGIEVREIKGNYGSTDHKLVECALQNQIPVVSEDKQILKTLKSEGHTYFNALVMLNLLLFREQISKDKFDYFRRRLGEYAWYSKEIWQFGQHLSERIFRDRFEKGGLSKS